MCVCVCIMFSGISVMTTKLSLYANSCWEMSFTVTEQIMGLGKMFGTRVQTTKSLQGLAFHFQEKIMLRKSAFLEIHLEMVLKSHSLLWFWKIANNF